MECLRTHGHIIKPVEIGKGLRVRLVLDEFFSSSVEETDVLCRQEEVHLIGMSCMHVVLTGSALRISSPFSSRIMRSTP